MNYTEIVKKLIGNIQPAGSASIDPERFENLKEMCKLVNELVIEIDKVACLKDRSEYSIKIMGEFANDFMQKTLGIKE